MDGRGFKLNDTVDRAAVGHEGVAVSTLRPSGIGLVDGRRCDVITRGLWLDAGRRFRVTDIEGTRLIVEPIGENSGSAAS
jgi:membrane-bound serine protease (ClpP class)